MGEHNVDIPRNSSQQTNDSAADYEGTMGIPYNVRKEKPEAYEPQVVSLVGGFDVGKRHLEKIIPDNLAKRVSDFMLLDDKLAVIRKRYGCSCFSNDEQECNLRIARAGIFLLLFLRNMPPRPGCQSRDHCSVSFISHTPYCHASRCSESFPRASEVPDDIMKLENQIPIFVLYKILKWEADTSLRLEEEENGQVVTRQWKSCIDQDLRSILRRACHTLSPFPHMSDGHRSYKSVGVEESSHLLEFVYKNIILSNHSTYRAKRKRIWKKSTKRTLPRASALEKKGVKFVEYEGLLNEIRFEGRTFYLPRIEMPERTDVFMRNLVAFEALALKRKTEPPTEPVRCYVELMDCLINDAADVEVLLNAGIICNHLGTVEEVASVWNGMKKGLDTKGEYEPIDTAIYGAIGFYDSKCRTMLVEFTETYFEKPWYLVAFIGGCISLFLSLWQMILAREQVQLQRESMKMG